MLVTKEEAMKKWCPMSRVMVTDDDADSVTAANRFGNSHSGVRADRESAKCLADGCMAWCELPGTSKGYCGLADK